MVPHAASCPYPLTPLDLDFPVGPGSLELNGDITLGLELWHVLQPCGIQAISNRLRGPSRVEVIDLNFPVVRDGDLESDFRFLAHRIPALG